MRLRFKIVSVGAVLAGVFLWGRCSHTKTTNVSQPANIMPSNDVEQIKVDPATHQLIITTAMGSHTVTLPDRTSTIDVLKNGTVNVTSPQYGLEHHLFLGLVGSDHMRFGVGLDAFYWKKLDIGIGVADQIGAYTPIAFAKVTYNIKGNMQAGIVYQSNQYIGGVLAVRVF